MFKEVSRVFQGSSNGVSRHFKSVSRKFQWCFKEVSRVFQGSFKGVSRKFQGCFKEVSWFLAAMRSLRSDGVTQFMCVSVCSHPRSFF